MAYSQGWDMSIQELFGAFNYGLAIMLQSWICVQWYHYVERVPQAWHTSVHHIMMLQQQHPMLLLTLAIQGYQHFLPSNIKLFEAPNSTKIGPIHSRSFKMAMLRFFTTFVPAMDFSTLYQH